MKTLYDQNKRLSKDYYGQKQNKAKVGPIEDGPCRLRM